MRYLLLFLLASSLLACPTTGTGDDDDAVGDDDDAANGVERGPLSRTMVGWTAGHDTAAICTTVGNPVGWSLGSRPTCNVVTFGRFGWLEDTDDLYISIETADDAIATNSAGTLDAAGADGGEVNDLPVDTDISVTLTSGIDFTFQLVWNDGEQTYDVNVSSFVTPE